MQIRPKNRLFFISVLLTILLLFFSGVLLFTTKKSPQELFGAILGSLQGDLVPSANDLFNCGGRDDCADDADTVNSGPQHKYVAQAYDQFGFPLSGVKYKWTKTDANNLLKFRDLDTSTVLSDESETVVGDVDQSIYLQPNDEVLKNGEATVNVLGYLDNDLTKGKSQAVNVNLYFCLNTWPNTATFPFADKNPSLQSNPYTNFKTYYCKDRGSVVDISDDYPSLRVVERSNKGVGNDNSFMCSGGGGNNLKCNSDYYKEFVATNNPQWQVQPLVDYPNWDNSITSNLLSPETIAISGNQTLITSGYKWAFIGGASSDMAGQSPAYPFVNYPPAFSKPTGIAWDGNYILIIQNNYFVRTTDGGATWSTSSPLKTLAEDGWPADVQFPTEVGAWSHNSHLYLLALKDDLYRIYSTDNKCTNLKCNDAGGYNRTWGSCTTADQCYWEDAKTWSQESIPAVTNLDWANNMKFPIKTVGLDNNRNLFTSSCEHSKGTCLLKEFLLISNSACSDGIDNDKDGTCDWQDGICGVDINNNPILLDSNCSNPDDNSESGTCSDGIDNDNDGAIDYPADFSCTSAIAVEEEPCTTECCDNKDNDSDNFVDQNDTGCTAKADLAEANACANGADDDGDDLIDLKDPGCTSTLDNSEQGTTECDDGIDNDGDGKIDFNVDLTIGDNQCLDFNDNSEGGQSRSSGPFTLTYTASANGTVTGSASQSVNLGANGTSVTAVPTATYRFISWSDGVTTNPRTDINVINNITVTATFALNTSKTITSFVVAGQTGIINQTTHTIAVTIPFGTAVTNLTPTITHTGVSVNPDSGAANDFTTAKPYTVTAANSSTQNYTVTVTVAPVNTFILTYIAGINGTITGTSPQTVNSGSNGQSVNALANANYSFVNWSDGSTANPRTDNNISGNITVTANFAINTFTLTYTAGANGTITGISPQTVNFGSNGTSVTATASANYSFDKWSDNSTTNPRTDNNVSGNITVTANFVINTFTLTYTAGANGTITGTSPQTVNSGSNSTSVTAVPNANYSFVNWSDGVTTSSRTDTNVSGNITVTANFIINTYTLTYTADANGTITGTSPQVVNSGSNGTSVTAVPNTNYSFVNWSDGSTANPRTDNNISGNITVTANFAPSGVSYGGEDYPIVQIGTQYWFAKNLNIGTQINSSTAQSNNAVLEKYCYFDNPSYCPIYGGLYQWAESIQYINGATNTTDWGTAPGGNIQGICPAGWHIPTAAEFTTLSTFLGGDTAAGKHLKETGTIHWGALNTSANADNSSGFTAYGAGWYAGSGSSELQNAAKFWTSSPSVLPSIAYDRELYQGDTSFTSVSRQRVFAESIRCLKD